MRQERNCCQWSTPVTREYGEKSVTMRDNNHVILIIDIENRKVPKQSTSLINVRTIGPDPQGKQYSIHCPYEQDIDRPWLSASSALATRATSSPPEGQPPTINSSQLPTHEIPLQGCPHLSIIAHSHGKENGKKKKG